MNTHSNIKSPKGMSLLLKILLGFILLSLSIIIIIPIAAYLFFNPNDFKAPISAFITEKSGLPLEIKGNIAMRYFPSIALDVEDVQLPQAPGFGQGEFIKIDSIAFKIPLSELFQHQFVVESLSITGLNIQLVKLKDGTTNWDFFSKQVKENAPKSSESIPQEEVKQANINKRKKLSFSLENFDIKNAAITLDDQKQQETISISQLHLNGVANQPNGIPIDGSFDFEQINKKSTFVKGHHDYHGTLTYGKNILFKLKSNISLEFPQNISQWQKAKADMNVNFDSTRGISIKDLHVQSGGLDINGACSIPLNDDAITFNLNMNELNLDQIMANGFPSPSISTQSSAFDTKVQPKTKQAPQKASTSNKPINGEILIQKLIVKNLSMTNVKAIVKKNNNILNINPLTASLYQGNIKVQASKDLNNENVPTTFQGTVSNVQIQPLLTSFKQERRLTGSADIDFNLAQNGQDLNGITKVHLKNGTIRGIDVRYYLSLAQSVFNKEKNPLPDNQTTTFGDLTATLNIHDNMIDNNDLTIQATDFKANGEGSIYLGSQTIEYKIQAWRQYKDNKEHPNDYPLAIRIKGSFDHPKIEPDMDLYLKKGLEKEVKKQINKQIEKNIGKILGGDSQPQSEQNSETQQASPEDQLKKKIEDKINKKLNKLFKKKDENE